MKIEIKVKIVEYRSGQCDKDEKCACPRPCRMTTLSSEPLLACGDHFKRQYHVIHRNVYTVYMITRLLKRYSGIERKKKFF